METKVALVTGGSAGGIGAAVAVEYAKLGYKVAMTGRNLDRLNETVQACTDISPNKNKSDFLALIADFEKPEGAEDVVGKTIEAFGRLDILINNAGYTGQFLSFLSTDFYEDFKNIIQVNLMAATRLAQLAAPHLIETKGVIVNVSSISDRLAYFNPSYCVSKAGLSMLTKCLVNSFHGTGVRVVTVCPGPIYTNIFKMKNQEEMPSAPPGMKIGMPKDCAETIVFLTSDKASFINGTNIDIDGGLIAQSGHYEPPNFSVTK